MDNNVSSLKRITNENFGIGQFPGAPGIYRQNLNYEVERVSNEGEKQLSLVRLLRENEGTGVVYAATAKEVKAISDYLKHIGFNVAPYHEHLGAGERRRNLDRFLAGEPKAIVATSDIVAEINDVGVDQFNIRPDISFVIHYNMPGSLEAYYQESAVASHDSPNARTARCTLLFQNADRRAQLFFAGARQPKAEEVIAVYETLESLNADAAPAPLEQIQARVSEVARTKVRVIISLLKNMGFIKEHRGARYTLLKRDLNAREMERLAGEYTSRSETDREKHERMIRYGQSPECRWKLMLEYFDPDARLKECGHCDNCLHPVAEQFHAPESAARPDFIDLLFAYHQQEEAQIRPGDMVKLPAHGEVRVKAVEGDKIVVSLPGGETRKFKQEWVIR
ncbi:MAG: RecQ family zinc-binding domain-containing protein [Blastocatellales bacterium]